MLRELTQLRRALILIGLDDDAATCVTTRTALDSIPALRRRALTYLQANPAQRPTARNVADAIGYSTGAVNRTLEDLAAHQLVIRHSVDGGQHHWQLAGLAMTVGFRTALTSVACPSGSTRSGDPTLDSTEVQILYRLRPSATPGGAGTEEWPPNRQTTVP